MGFLLLLRHRQASLGTADYDQLPGSAATGPASLVSAWLGRISR